MHLRGDFCVAKNLKLLKERSRLCPRLLGGSLGMSCLIGMSLFAWESWVTLDSLTKKLRVQALSHMVQSTSRRTGD